MEPVKFVLKSSILYASFSAAFSVIGLFPIFGEFLPKPYLIGNPLEVSGISVEHVVGHIVFGLMVGAAALKMRYFVLAGILPLALDSDHLIQFLNLDAVPRMGHSVAFAAVSVALMMFLLGKRDFRLGAVSFATVLSHISFDVLLGGTTAFPIFIPLQNKMITFHGYDWVFFLLVAIAIVGITTLVTKKAQLPKQTV